MATSGKSVKVCLSQHFYKRSLGNSLQQDPDPSSGTLSRGRREKAGRARLLCFWTSVSALRAESLEDVCLSVFGILFPSRSQYSEGLQDLLGVRTFSSENVTF